MQLEIEIAWNGSWKSRKTKPTRRRGHVTARNRGVTKTRSETAERETPKTQNSGAKRSQKFSGPFRSLGARGLTKMRNHRRETVNVSGSVVSALLKVNYLLT
jgi:hypothetical protein